MPTNAQIGLEQAGVVLPASTGASPRGQLRVSPGDGAAARGWGGPARGLRLGPRRAS